MSFFCISGLNLHAAKAKDLRYNLSEVLQGMTSEPVNRITTINLISVNLSSSVTKYGSEIDCLFHFSVIFHNLI